MKSNRGKIGNALQADGATRPSYFVPELDGITAPDRETAAEWEVGRLDAEAEADAENGWLRAAENNDRYAWEDEQDRMRAAAFGFAY